MPSTASRRDFLKTSGTLLAATAASGGGFHTSAAAAEKPSKSPNERLTFGCLGLGIRFREVGPNAINFGPVGALCDVDMLQAGRGLEYALNHHAGKGYLATYIPVVEDYRRVLDNKDIDVVLITTPDHWHTKQLIEALQAGKDVYAEKPLTLTIDEGKLIRKVLASTGRVLQIGTQQRTEMGQRFPTAAAVVRDGRIGEVKKITCAIGGSMESESLPIAEPPPQLNWDLWQGPTPDVPYRASPTVVVDGYGPGHPYSRTHNFFRWWYEYSGGKLTDWGAHHVDIAMWAMQLSDGSIGPYTIDPLESKHPVPFKEGYPTLDDRFNAALTFKNRLTFNSGLVLDIVDNAEKSLGFENGIMFEGTKGRFFVNREKLTGKPIEELASNPLPSDALEKLYGHKPPESHMGNFVDCVKTRKTPVSDFESHHRHISACHATNIAMRLGRKLTYDPAKEEFVGDVQANTFLAREYRKGFEIAM